MRMLPFHFLITEGSMGVGPITLQEAESEPIKSISVLFPDELWDVLVEQPNIYVAQKQRNT